MKISIEERAESSRGKVGIEERVFLKFGLIIKKWWCFKLEFFSSSKGGGVEKQEANET